MISKIINNEEFKNAIRVGFNEDNVIYSLYCPKVKVLCIDDIIDDIFNRIKSDTRNITIKGVYEKNKLIGYHAYDDKTLISFALNTNYRSRKYLHAFWDLISKDLRGGFDAFMWTINQRGIKWLLKNNMKIGDSDNLITHLIF